MEVALSPELEKFVQEQVETGRFASVSELFEASLTQMMLDSDFDDPEEVAALEESEQQLARGEVLDFRQVAEEFRREFSGRSANCRMQ